MDGVLAMVGDVWCGGRVADGGGIALRLRGLGVMPDESSKEE